MSKASEIQRELERWKDKYFEQSDSFEEKNKATEEFTALLQRILVRVSLAAENTSEDLDKELASLRVAIRSATPKNHDLSNRLKRIDDIILASEENKQENANKIIKALGGLIKQLQALNITRKQKSKLKKLNKVIEKADNSSQEQGGLLSQYADIQADILNDLIDPTKKEQGFFSRLLGGNDEVESLPSAQTDQADTNELELEVEEEPEDENEVAPGFTSIATHIRGTLNNLLDQLTFPVSASREVARMRDQIEKEILWYELGPTLDDIVNLILSVVGKGQREFARFLMQLDERLIKVQDFLTESQKIENQWQDKNITLDRNIRDQVNEISQELDKDGDMDVLKRSISDHLDSISKAVDQHAGDGEFYDQAKESEVKVLQERIKVMEQETIQIRQRLKEERGKALRDSLTGLANREAYDERLELEIERWKRYKKPATLVVADIDLFKRVNDEYGHLSGDKVLQIMAKEVQNRIRKTDFVARYGGEEFVIILPETSLEIAKEVIEKTREMICRLPFHFRDENVQISMSFGLAMFDEGLDQAGLFERADEALYIAKEKGRNRVEVWQDNSKS